jgi:hypothetical protein
MSSGTAPYATLNDLPRFEKRGEVTSAPWMKEQPVPHNGRAHNHEPYITCNSQTAPFATFHNQPLPLEPNKSKVQQAPWDRDELNDTKASNHQIPNPASFATEPIDSSSEDPCQTTFT